MQTIDFNHRLRKETSLLLVHSNFFGVVTDCQVCKMCQAHSKYWINCANLCDRRFWIAIWIVSKENPITVYHVQTRSFVKFSKCYTTREWKKTKFSSIHKNKIYDYVQTIRHLKKLIECVFTLLFIWKFAFTGIQKQCPTVKHFQVSLNRSCYSIKTNSNEHMNCNRLNDIFPLILNHKMHVCTATVFYKTNENVPSTNWIVDRLKKKLFWSFFRVHWVSRCCFYLSYGRIHHEKARSNRSYAGMCISDRLNHF